MDFGIARAVSDAQATMTQTAQVIGTAQYLSPEQARGERVDARSDLYSAGCLLYELLTGRPPFTGDSPVAIAYQHVRENPIPPSRVDPELPPGRTRSCSRRWPRTRATGTSRPPRCAATSSAALSGMPVAAPMPSRDILPGHPADGRQTRWPAAPTSAIPPYRYGPPRTSARRRAAAGPQVALGGPSSRLVAGSSRARGVRVPYVSGNGSSYAVPERGRHDQPGGREGDREGQPGGPVSSSRPRARPQGRR